MISTAIRTLAGVAAAGLIVTGLIVQDGVSDARWLAMLGIAWALLLVAVRIPLPTSMPTINRSVIRTALVFTTVFIVISAQLVRIQVVDSDAVYYRSAVSPDGETIGNPRHQFEELGVHRGQILDRDGEVIAESVQNGDVFERVYPEPATAYVAGYYSPLLYGVSGIEDSYNSELSGQAGNNPVQRVINDLLNRPQQGADVTLTLDADLQRTASNLLQDANGSVVVMDAETGEVLVLVSNPHYDPNQLFTASGAEAEAAANYWGGLVDDDDAPLVLRSNLGLYTPGSTFKTVTAAAAIENGYAEPNSVYEDDGQMVIDGRVLEGDNRPDESRTEWTLEEGLGWSLNVVYARVGLQVGATELWEAGEQFGFGETIPFDLSTSTGQLASSREFLSDNNALADTAFGQGQLLTTPLHMAMVAGAFANNGQMMEPCLVATIGDDRSSCEPSVWREAVSADTASDVQGMMDFAVENGAVTAAQVPGFSVGGKTGTAETGDGTAHSWFIGFIGTEDDPEYAVAVVVEEGHGGNVGAVSTGRDILTETIQSDD